MSLVDNSEITLVTTFYIVRDPYRRDILVTGGLYLGLVVYVEFDPWD